MPIPLSPFITNRSQGMWAEGPAYESKNIYKIIPGSLPPVNYDEHIFRTHSLTHLETPAHTQEKGRTLEAYLNKQQYFFGRVLVLKLSGNHYKQLGNSLFHWKISKEEIESRLVDLGISDLPPKIFITTELYPQNSDGYHDPNYVLTLSQEAADYLISINGFNLYGTSWKSSDYNPDKPGRPIHDTLFKKALILENLALKDVSEGFYFLVAYPLPIEGASESPVVPVLFTKEELLNEF
jgi:kynurenine formamidase